MQALASAITLRSERPWLGTSAILVAAYLAWAAAVPDGAARPLVSLILVVAAKGIAALAALLARRKIHGAPAERAWDYWCIGLALWSLSDALRLADWISFAELAPVPTLADLLRLAGYLSGAAGLAFYPTSPQERFGRLRNSLDITILWLAVLAMAWLSFIRPVIDSRIASAPSVFWTAYSPVFDLILAASSLRLLLLQSRSDQAALFRRILLAAVILTATDAASGLVGIQGDFRPGGWTDAGWMAAAALLAAAGLWQTGDTLQPGGRLPDVLRSRAVRFEPLLSVAFTYAVVGFTLLDWRFTGRVDWVGLTVAVILSLLLVTRQGAIAGQIEMRQFAAAVNVSRDVVFICDAGGRLRLANAALHRLLGRQGDPVWAVDRRPAAEAPVLADFLGPGHEPATILQEGLQSGWSGEVGFRRQDGAIVPVSLSLTPLHDERRAQPLVLGTAHDLTAIRQREADLRSALQDVAAARQELETLNRELERKVAARTEELAATVADLARLNEELKALDRLKNEFVALVSHELRAPLTNIRSGVELILTAPGNLGPSATRTLDLVQAETGRLSRFVETILDLSALEAGRFRFAMQPQDVAQTAEQVRRRFPEAVADRLVLDLPADLPPVLADDRALTSVFFHLVDNARKYASEGEIRMTAGAQAGQVRVSLSDRGPGIPEAERERVFEMFHRLDSSDAREVYGYGLGLHLVRRLLEAMGGGIRAEAGEAGGTRMLFWLPAAPQGT